MKIIKVGISGTLESSDAQIAIEPNANKGIVIRLKSTVETQFGDQINEVITSTLKELGVEDAIINVNDKGALDCVIKSRIQAAAHRAADNQDYKW